MWIHTIMHGLKEQRRATSTSHAGNTFVYLRKQPVLCCANETRAKWFSLNGSSLCIIARSENHQSRSSWQSGQYFILWSESAAARGLLSPEDTERQTHPVVLSIHRDTMFCSATHAMSPRFFGTSSVYMYMFIFQSCNCNSIYIQVYNTLFYVFRSNSSVFGTNFKLNTATLK